MVFNYELINKILEAIFPLPEHFGIITNEDYKPINFNKIYTSIKKIDKKANLYYGMSKLVISSPNFGGVVIKIPFNGYFESSKNKKNIYHWFYFNGAEAADFSDYCLAEYQKYLQLKKKNLHCFVAKTILFKKINNTRIFIQEYALPEEDNYKSIEKPSKESKKLADKLYHSYDISIDSEWIAFCLDKYGISKTKKFLNYCNLVDLSILMDASYDNYGYRKNKTPCIIDFSDFDY